MLRPSLDENSESARGMQDKMLQLGGREFYGGVKNLILLMVPNSCIQLYFELQVLILLPAGTNLVYIGIYCSG